MDPTVAVPARVDTRVTERRVAMTSTNVCQWTLATVIHIASTSEAAILVLLAPLDTQGMASIARTLMNACLRIHAVVFPLAPIWTARTIARLALRATKGRDIRTALISTNAWLQVTAQLLRPVRTWPPDSIAPAIQGHFQSAISQDLFRPTSRAKTVRFHSARRMLQLVLRVTVPRASQGIIQMERTVPLAILRFALRAVLW